MKAWAELTGRKLEPWQWQALLAMDKVVMGQWDDPGARSRFKELFQQFRILKQGPDG
jgi:hypothetical protein